MLSTCRNKIMESKDDAPVLLLVEDNAVHERVITILCEKFGYSVSCVRTGRDALSRLESSSGGYSAILMDWRLSDMDGLECTRRIRALEKPGERVPIIAVTANAFPADRDTCLEAGMDDYLSKPFTAEEFRSMVQRWCNITRGASG